VAYLEGGQRKPSLPPLVKLAQRLRVPIRDFFADVKTKPSTDDGKAIAQFSHLFRSKTPKQKRATINSLKTLPRSFKQ
jgi:hypothetical protein